MAGGAVDDGERQVQQEALFYEFSLERARARDHLLRAIDRFVDLAEIRGHLAPFYSAIGRPSIDPELLIRMLIIGYCFGIRSERRLCEEVHLNLAYRWFCRLGLDGGVPDHSTFSKNRHGRFRDSDLLRQLFETMVRRCMAEGMVGGEGFAVDASMIGRTRNRQRGRRNADGLEPESQAGPSTNISPPSTMPRSAPPRRSRRSSSRRSTRPRAGPPPGRPGRLRLLRQLSDRRRARGHRRCGAPPRGAPSRGDAPPRP